MRYLSDPWALAVAAMFSARDFSAALVAAFAAFSALSALSALALARRSALLGLAVLLAVLLAPTFSSFCTDAGGADFFVLAGFSRCVVAAGAVVAIGSGALRVAAGTGCASAAAAAAPSCTMLWLLPLSGL